MTPAAAPDACVVMVGDGGGASSPAPPAAAADDGGDAAPGGADGGRGTPATRAPVGARCCTHNAWDNVRVVKGMMTLRCRVCQRQWRLNTQEIPRCSSFSSARGCAAADGCPKLHIYPRKQNLSERLLHHGAEVLRGQQERERQQQQKRDRGGRPDDMGDDSGAEGEPAGVDGAQPVPPRQPQQRAGPRQRGKGTSAEERRRKHGVASASQQAAMAGLEQAAAAAAAQWRQQQAAAQGMWCAGAWEGGPWRFFAPPAAAAAAHPGMDGYGWTAAAAAAAAAAAEEAEVGGGAAPPALAPDDDDDDDGGAAPPRGGDAARALAREQAAAAAAHAAAAVAAAHPHPPRGSDNDDDEPEEPEVIFCNVSPPPAPPAPPAAAAEAARGFGSQMGAADALLPLPAALMAAAGDDGAAGADDDDVEQRLLDALIAGGGGREPPGGAAGDGGDADAGEADAWAGGGPAAAPSDRTPEQLADLAGLGPAADDDARAVQVYLSTPHGAEAVPWRTERMRDGAVAWRDRPYRYVDVPDFLEGGVLVRTPHKILPAGSQLLITARRECDLYLLHECSYCGKGRDGGFPATLHHHGWRPVREGPRWVPAESAGIDDGARGGFFLPYSCPQLWAAGPDAGARPPPRRDCAGDFSPARRAVADDSGLRLKADRSGCGMAVYHLRVPAGAPAVLPRTQGRCVFSVVAGAPGAPAARRAPGGHAPGTCAQHAGRDPAARPLLDNPSAAPLGLSSIVDALLTPQVAWSSHDESLSSPPQSDMKSDSGSSGLSPITVPTTTTAYVTHPSP